MSFYKTVLFSHCHIMVLKFCIWSAACNAEVNFIYFSHQDSSRLFKNHGTFCLLSVKWTVFISCLQGRLGKCMISKTLFIWLGWKGWYNHNYSGASSYTALTWVLSNSWWRAGISVEQDVKNIIKTCGERSLITSASVKYVSWHVALCLLLGSTSEHNICSLHFTLLSVTSAIQ